MSRGQSSKAAVVKSELRAKAGSGAVAAGGGASRPRRPTPWIPAAQSCFVRPEPPPLQTFGGTPAAAKVERSGDRGGSRSGAIVVPTVARATVTGGTAIASVSARKPAPADVPPPNVGAVVRTKPAPETLPPPPVGEIGRRAVVVEPATVIVIVPEAQPEPEDVAAFIDAIEVATEPEVLGEAKLEAVHEVEALDDVELEALFEPVHALAQIAHDDSVPLVVLERAMPRTTPPASMAATALSLAARGAEVLPSNVPTLEAPVLTNLAPAQRERVGLLPFRRRIAVALGVAASLLLAVGIAASPDATPRTEHDVAHGGLSLAASLPTPALPSSWTAQAELAPQAAANDTELTAANDRLVALSIASPADAVVPELDPTPQPKRTRRSRSGAQAPAPEVETTPAPAPAPRRTASRRVRPVSAKELLHDGEVALALGDAKQAYRLAKRSHESGERTDAASLMARSACRIGERDEAKRALRELPLLERGAVRRDCRRSGSRIGL